MGKIYLVKAYLRAALVFSGLWMGAQVQAAPSGCDNSRQEKKDQEVKQAAWNPSALALYRPQYFLPIYYTAEPYQQVYAGAVPQNQKLSKREFKAQLSFQLPIVQSLGQFPLDFVAAYTQVFYWQAYVDSAFFRETNYEPEIFLRAKLSKQLFLNLGLSHQSNGQGGSLERSWNRLYVDFQYDWQNFYISLKPWLLVNKGASSQRYNPTISRYFGFGQVILSYRYQDFISSLMLRNLVESRFKRPSGEFTLGFPKMQRFRVYMQLFSGFGASLIEYDHASFGAGLGLALNDWP